MNIDEITTETFNSPSELNEFEEYLSLGQAIPTRWAFRGQSGEYGSLKPSFQRIFGQKHPRRTAEDIERDLIKTFREHYEKLNGRSFDMPDPNMIGTNFDLRCLSVMQHYGVPTRLLDWTSNYWTAVYFACASDPTKNAELWFYDREIFSEQLQSTELAPLLSYVYPGQIGLQEPKLLGSRTADMIIEFDPQLTPRMKNQFAHHTFCLDPFTDHAQLLFERSQNSTRFKEDNKHLLQRIVINAACKQRALDFLAKQRQVTAGTIFPDVEGLNKFLHWHLESLLTTMMD